MVGRVTKCDGKTVEILCDQVRVVYPVDVLKQFGYEGKLNEEIKYNTRSPGQWTVAAAPKKTRKARVYIAGPMTIGNHYANIRGGMYTFERLRDAGFVPFCPHWSAQQQMFCPMTNEQWLEYDKEWLLECDYLFRIQGESKDADEEEKFARMHDIMVVHTWAEVERLPREVPL